MEKNQERILRDYDQKLRKATDEQVMYKLNTTEGIGYEHTEREAKRRGLI